MAESKKRKKAAYVPPRRAGRDDANPVWLVPTIVSLFILGVLWVIVYYVSGAKYPLDIGNLNILVGFGFLIVGFIFTTRWK